MIKARYVIIGALLALHSTTQAMHLEMPDVIQASRAGNYSDIQKLIAQKVDLDTKDGENKTALMWAIERKHTKIAQALINAHAQLNVQDYLGNTPLITAVNLELTPVVRDLIAHGAAVDIQDHAGRSALFFAAIKGLKNLVQLLINAGANIEIRTAQGQTPLMIAACVGQDDIVKALIANGADIHVKDHFSASAFTIATRRHNITVAQRLIAAGANLYKGLQDYDWYAHSTGQVQELFTCSQAPFNAVKDAHYAQKHAQEVAQLRTVNRLVKEEQMRLDFVDSHGNTLLHYAVLSGNRVMIGLLVYLMIKHQQFDAFDYRTKKEKLTPVEMAVAKSGARLLQPFSEAAIRYKNNHN